MSFFDCVKEGVWRDPVGVWDVIGFDFDIHLWYLWLSLSVSRPMSMFPYYPMSWTC